MATSKSGAQLAAKFTAVAYAAGKANREATSAAALTYKESLIGAATTDTGGDLRLGHWGWNGKRYRQPKIGAGYDVYGYENAKAVVRPRPYGLWAFLEGGAKPHVIVNRKRNKRKAMRFASGEFATTANHPGARGRKTFTKGAKAGERPAMRIFKLTHQRALLRNFR
jgi:hypothetical protein